MKTLVIDRFERGYAFCEEYHGKPAKKKQNSKEMHYFGIETSELPEGVDENTVLKISDDGTLSIDEKSTAELKKMLEEKKAK